MVEYYNFDEVMGELEVSEGELRRMVSEGELRAFRSENKMKFRKEDVQGLQKGRQSEPTIILPTEIEGSEDDAILDLDLDAEVEAVPEAAAGAAEVPELELDTDDIIEPEAVVEEEIPELEAAVEPEEEISTLEELPAEEAEVGLDDLTVDAEPEIAEAEETMVDEEMDTASTTAPLAFADESVETVEEGEEAVTGELTEEGEIIEEEGITAPRRAARRAGAGAAVAVAAPLKAHWVWSVFLFLGFAPCLLIAMIFTDDFMMSAGKADKPSGSVAWLYEMIGEKFWEDGEWKSEMIKDAPQGLVGTDIPEQDPGAPIGKGERLKVYLRSYNEFGTYRDPDDAKTADAPSE